MASPCEPVARIPVCLCWLSQPATNCVSPRAPSDARVSSMKAEWQVPGRATGLLRCTLRLPAIEKDLRRTTTDSLLVARRFIDKNLARAADSVLENATFTISLEIRAPKRGARWRPICRWREGDSIDAAFERAAAIVSSIPQEPSHEPQAYRGMLKSRALLGESQKK